MLELGFVCCQPYFIMYRHQHTIFPALPESPLLLANSLLIDAYNIISGSYSSALQLLHEEDNDAIQLRIHGDRIVNCVLPLLEALENEIQDDIWIDNVAAAILELLDDIYGAAAQAETVFVLNFIYFFFNHLILRSEIQKMFQYLY